MASRNSHQESKSDLHSDVAEGQSAPLLRPSEHDLESESAGTFLPGLTNSLPAPHVH